MKTIIILPYFGKFGNYFQLFLNSCKMNKDFDWLIITDDLTKYVYPDNAKVIYMSFKKFRMLVQAKFNFTISLDQPYKLCDYKPAYGYILEDLIHAYDYWGHCDCDLIFGDLSPVISIEKSGYDKIFAAGHFTLYKNSFDNNRIFMLPYHNKYVYKEAFTSNSIYVFDENVECDMNLERNNIHQIFKFYKKSIYDHDLSFNVSTYFDKLKRCYYNSKTENFENDDKLFTRVFWNNGKIYSVSLDRKLKFINEEFIYIHLQQRSMSTNVNNKNTDKFEIRSSKFVSYRCIPTKVSNFLIPSLFIPSKFTLNKVLKKVHFVKL